MLPVMHCTALHCASSFLPARLSPRAPSSPSLPLTLSCTCPPLPGLPPGCAGRGAVPRGGGCLPAGRLHAGERAGVLGSRCVRGGGGAGGSAPLHPCAGQEAGVGGLWVIAPRVKLTLVERLLAGGGWWLGQYPS